MYRRTPGPPPLPPTTALSPPPSATNSQVDAFTYRKQARTQADSKSEMRLRCNKVNVLNAPSLHTQTSDWACGCAWMRMEDPVGPESSSKASLPVSVRRVRRSGTKPEPDPESANPDDANGSAGPLAESEAKQGTNVSPTPKQGRKVSHIACTFAHGGRARGARGTKTACVATF